MAESASASKVVDPLVALGVECARRQSDVPRICSKGHVDREFALTNQLAGSPLIGYAGNERYGMNASEPAGDELLRGLARHVSATHPDAERFAARALAEIESLRKRLAFAEQLTASLERAAALAAEQYERQSSLVLEQAGQYERADAQLRAVKALCEMADWSARTADVQTRSAVLVEDLEHVLRGINIR